MLYYLKGELAYRENGMCVVDCGGVGYRLTVSLNTSDALITKVGKEVKIFTYLAVREDGVELFGFGTTDERDCFNKLTSVSGVGPKVAMSILSTLPPEKLVLAICTEDVKAIAKAPGIGSKTAARIVLELKDKFSDDMLSATSGASDSVSVPQKAIKSGVFSEAAEALTVLGYDKNTVLDALKGVNPDTKDVGEVIKAALKKLAR
ncbi:MAG: Holliday junction branch migration protein RuvA [Clostridia bacterium]|nr:Holliday junction branch migration protein RuvA [Clostridia bacterium]